jgi:DNA-binding Lrp family transcriptional regulator
MAQTARAYILIETTPDKTNSVRQRLGSLGNCLALTEMLIHSEVVAHLECNDLRSLNEVITNEIASIEGVSRVTTWLTMSRR